MSQRYDNEKIIKNRIVRNWFTKKPLIGRWDEVSPQNLKKEIKDRIIQAIVNANPRNKIVTMKILADAVWNTIETESIKNRLMAISSDTRAPIVSLYHHMKNTAAFAVCMAYDHPSKLSDSEIQLIRISALLHDIGKIDVFDNPGTHFSEHVVFTKKWFEDLINGLERKGFKVDDRDRNIFQRLVRTPACHHKSRGYREKGLYWVDHIEQIIADADTLSSRNDRLRHLLEQKDNIFPRIINNNLIMPGEDAKGIISSKEKIYEEITSMELPSQEEIDSEDEKYHSIAEKLQNYKFLLLLVDLPGIQKYIFETKKLPLIGGASHNISTYQTLIVEEIAKIIAPEVVVYSGGGNIVAILPSSFENRKEVIKNNIIKVIGSKSSNAIMPVVYISKPIDGLKFAEFGSLVSEHFEKMEEERYSNVIESVISKPRRSNEICSFCGKRLASDTYRNDPICDVCKGKKDSRDEVDKHTVITQEFVNSILEGVEMSNEFEHIGDTIALVILDGNMIGTLMKATRTMADYNFKSEILDREIKGALKDTVKYMLKNYPNLIIHQDPNNGRRYFGFREIYVGGDDVQIVIRAEAVFMFVRKFIENVSERFRFSPEGYPNLEKNIVTLSGGITIAKHTFPVYFMLDKALELEKKSKDAFRQGIWYETINDINYKKIPMGSIAVCGIGSSMPTEEETIFVFESKSTKLSRKYLHTTDFNFLVHSQNGLGILERYINKNRSSWNALINTIINLEDDEITKLNFRKYLYASMDKKEIFGSDNANALNELKNILRILEDDRYKGFLQNILPLLGGESGE